MITADIARSFKRQGAPIAQFVTEDGGAWGLHWTPEESQLSGIGWTYGTTERQGRKPLNRPQGQQLRTMSFTHPVTSNVENQSCTEVIRIMIGLADSGQKVRLINVAEGLETVGWWYPSLSVRIVERDVNQQVKRAELSWTLTEANDERPLIARVPPPPPPPPPPAVATPAPSMQADYTVVSGDSLWKIAAKFLGNGTRWREIYDLNQARLKLKPPEMFRGLLTVWIYPGQVLKIPAR